MDGQTFLIQGSLMNITIFGDDDSYIHHFVGHLRYLFHTLMRNSPTRPFGSETMHIIKTCTPNVSRARCASIRWSYRRLISMVNVSCSCKLKLRNSFSFQLTGVSSCHRKNGMRESPSPPLVFPRLHAGTPRQSARFSPPSPVHRRQVSAVYLHMCDQF